jgi:endonuclease YncB( thermonuclease family)
MTRRIRVALAAPLAITLLLAAALVAGCTPSAPVTSERSSDAPHVTRAEVIRHTDGDTARFRLDGGAEEKVRFIGIDTPEVREKMLNARLVLDGYAQAFTYPPNVKYTATLKNLQAEAREANRGLWAE